MIESAGRLESAFNKNSTACTSELTHWELRQIFSKFDANCSSWQEEINVEDGGKANLR